MEDGTPDNVYRLASRAEWRETIETGWAPKRDIDERDGYFHLSTRDQVIETANLHFAGHDDLLALEIPTAKIAGQLKFELAPTRGEMFPHLYGDLGRNVISRAIALVNTNTGFEFGAPD